MFSSRKKFSKVPQTAQPTPNLSYDLLPRLQALFTKLKKIAPAVPLEFVRNVIVFFFMQEVVSRNVKFRHPNKCRFQYRVQKKLVVSFCSACCNGLAESIHAVVVVVGLRGLHLFRKRAITFVLNSIEDKVCIKQVTIFGVRNYYGLELLPTVIIADCNYY